MKKLYSVLAALCLLLSTALAEPAPALTLRSGVTLGMRMEAVMAAENGRYELDQERTRGPVHFTELEYEHITENGMPADLKYIFHNDVLVAVRFSYDTEDKGVSLAQIKGALEQAYGPSAALDRAALGNGIYAVDDDGRPEGSAEAWTVGSVMIVLERDEDDVDVTYVDLAAAYVNAQ